MLLRWVPGGLNHVRLSQAFFGCAELFSPTEFPGAEANENHRAWRLLIGSTVPRLTGSSARSRSWPAAWVDTRSMTLDLRALGPDVFGVRHRAAAQAVAREMASRARQNVETLVDRLQAPTSAATARTGSTCRGRASTAWSVRRRGSSTTSTRRSQRAASPGALYAEGYVDPPAGLREGLAQDLLRL